MRLEEMKTMKNENAPAPEYFTKREAARFAAVSPRWLDYQRQAGRLPWIALSPRRILISRSDLVSMIEGHRVGGQVRA
jgi:hypothetical protein